VYICGYKLERGTNSNTVWTPAATEIVGSDGKDGKDGADADYYKLAPIKEQAYVSYNGDLEVYLSY